MNAEPVVKIENLHKQFDYTPPREIAAPAGVSVEAVKSRLRRGLAQNDR